MQGAARQSPGALTRDEADLGGLGPLQIKPSGGKCPRNFNFDVTGRWMIVGNQNSNNLTTFRIDQETGALSQACQVDIPLPNYVFALRRSTSATSAEE